MCRLHRNVHHMLTPLGFSLTFVPAIFPPFVSQRLPRSRPTTTVSGRKSVLCSQHRRYGFNRWTAVRRSAPTAIISLRSPSERPWRLTSYQIRWRMCA